MYERRLLYAWMHVSVWMNECMSLYEWMSACQCMNEWMHVIVCMNEWMHVIVWMNACYCTHECMLLYVWMNACHCMYEWMHDSVCMNEWMHVIICTNECMSVYEWMNACHCMYEWMDVIVATVHTCRKTHSETESLLPWWCYTIGLVYNPNKPLYWTSGELFKKTNGTYTAKTKLDSRKKDRPSYILVTKAHKKSKSELSKTQWQVPVDA